MARKQSTISEYDRLYSQEGSFNETWDGKISTVYKIPKYLNIFFDEFKNYKGLTFLELGAGNGEITELILRKKPKFVKRYIATELSSVGVRKMREKGIEAYKMDVNKLKFKSNSFDVVCCFNVMHHVDNPAKMAQEMMRVARKRIFLIEANGMCILRKLIEKTERNKKANEHSYFPWEYKSFFYSGKTTPAEFKISPFLYVFPLTPPLLIKTAIAMSETLEKIPLMRWQASGVHISVRK